MSTNNICFHRENRTISKFYGWKKSALLWSYAIYPYFKYFYKGSRSYTFHRCVNVMHVPDFTEPWGPQCVSLCLSVLLWRQPAPVAHTGKVVVSVADTEAVSVSEDGAEDWAEVGAEVGAAAGVEWVKVTAKATRQRKSQRSPCQCQSPLFQFHLPHPHPLPHPRLCHCPFP